ncbi:hypothetical protein [Agrococcus sp. Marseille-P2731]|uniref:hypothetical protein n=1 Tax=Agrococcus sp. Marseille-P2731 TaxID=1841862 RepID=UPI000931FFD9|nr:hypothetical protein [Agrococcus sp. Marseille-P2731]
MSDSNDGRPGPSEHADDGTTVIGADPDMATDPADTDVEASPEGGTEDQRASDVGDHGADADRAGDHSADDHHGASRA